MEKHPRIEFQNPNNPKSGFDLVILEELLHRTIDFDISRFHIVDFYHILFVISGNGRHTIDFTDYDYDGGTILTIKKGQLQKFLKGTNAKGYILAFTEDFIASRFSKQEVLKSIQLFNDLLSYPRIELQEKEFTDILALVKNMESEYFTVSDKFSEDIMRSALHMLIVKLFRIKDKQLPRQITSKYIGDFIRFQDLIEENYITTRKVSDYAKMMACTTKTLNNISHHIIHKSAKQLIDEIVITHIKRLLLNTNLSIKEIAFASGFEETTNIYKYFKKVAKCSPESFRQFNK